MGIVLERSWGPWTAEVLSFCVDARLWEVGSRPSLEDPPWNQNPEPSSVF